MAGQGSHRRPIDVLSYSDLTESDILVLSKVLTHTHTGLQGRDKDTTRKLISELPPHLRSIIPLLTFFCSSHNKLNPLPITSLLNAFKEIVEVDVPAMAEALSEHEAKDSTERNKMIILEDLSGLWLRQDEFFRRYGRSQVTHPPYPYKPGKCAACILSAISCSAEALTTLGTCFIGRVGTTKWMSSKRIRWIEECIRNRAAVEDRKEMVQKMWKTGTELRRLRKAGYDSRHDCAVVDNSIRKAKSTENRNPVRPPRSPTQNDHAAFANVIWSRGTGENQGE